MSNSLDPDQDRQNVGPDLGPNSLQRLSADNTCGQRVKHSYHHAVTNMHNFNGAHSEENG